MVDGAVLCTLGHQQMTAYDETYDQACAEARQPGAMSAARCSSALLEAAQDFEFQRSQGMLGSV